MAEDPIVIAGAARTPMGGLLGTLAPVTAPQLGAQSIRESLSRAELKPEEIDEVIMGCVLSAGVKQGPARQAALQGGLPTGTGATTINKLCGSGMKSVMLAHDLIKAGTSRLMVAGGMESMTNAPYVLEKARSGLRMGHGEIKDHMFLDGLEDAETGELMGCFAQNVADEYGIGREEMDEFAIDSLKRAQQAIDDATFEDEITPVTYNTRKGEVSVAVDEQPGNANIDKIAQLKPAFKKDGTVTAANASSISDGAASLVLMPQSEAEARGLLPLARIAGHTTYSRHPSEFTLAPVGALEGIFEKTGWHPQDVDLYEINEAFAMVSILPIKEFGLARDQVNIHGGACALGHPIGASGTRILVTLLHAMHRQGKQRGVASLCIGGGEATAVAVERI